MSSPRKENEPRMHVEIEGDPGRITTEGNVDVHATPGNSNELHMRATIPNSDGSMNDDVYVAAVEDLDVESGANVEMGDVSVSYSTSASSRSSGSRTVVGVGNPPKTTRGTTIVGISGLTVGKGATMKIGNVSVSGG